MNEKSPWVSIGVPEGYFSPEICFHLNSRTLFASVSKEAEKGKHPRSTILFKREDGHQYEVLFHEPDFVSQDDWCMRNHCEYAFFVRREWRLRSDVYGKKFWGGDWLDVSRICIDSLTHQVFLEKERLILPELYKRGWVSRVLDIISADTILVVVGLIAEGSSVAEYWVSQLSFRSPEPIRLVRLEKTFL